MAALLKCMGRLGRPGGLTAPNLRIPFLRSASGWASPGHGMYGEPGPDPTNGRARWHTLDGPSWKEKDRPPYGAHNTQEYDEKHGRRWWQKKEVFRPKLYTTIGKHARSPRLSRTIVRWAGNTPNFRKLKRDVYRKRWPKPDQLNYRLFAEFCLKEFNKRTLLETAHTLPLYGAGCKFWRAPDENHPETKGQYFVADKIEYRLRPIRGDILGTQYLYGRPARAGIAPIAKSLGSWRFETPENAHPLVYRPPFPEMAKEERTADFPVDRNDDVSGVISSASTGPLRDYQERARKGLSKTEISEKVGRSEHWVKRWWREHPATLERPAGSRDVVLKKASINAFRDLDIRRRFISEDSTYKSLVDKVTWRQAKVVARDPNTGELALRYNEKGQSLSAGRQVADYSGGLDFLDEILQKVLHGLHYCQVHWFTQMNIRDPQARIFMNFYADGKDKVAAHRHDFWTCLLSFGSPRILTVDNRPVLLRDGDLIVFGTQNHGVPPMPDISDGRVSLVIFFYPDADNLERQWQTINEDEEEKSSADVVQLLSGGMDKGFKASLLWGESKDETSKSCECGTDSAASALTQALDPGLAKRRVGHAGSLLSSPNSDLQFESQQQPPAAPAAAVFSIATGGQNGYTADERRVEEKDFFKWLTGHGITSLWDFRLPREGDWSEPSNLKRACAARSIAYRSYPLGRREAGGIPGHLRSEEGQDVLRRFAEVATLGGRAAFAVAQSGHSAGTARAEVAERLLVTASVAKVLHILPGGQLEDGCALARKSKEVDYLGAYAQGVKKQLESAPDESLNLLALSRRLSANRVQLLSDLRQQAQRLQAVSNEKTQLSLEINNLQDALDRHALLQSNYDVIKASQVSASEDLSSEISGNSTELLLSSRQRALLGSLAVTTQESSGMRQHGFFVDVLSLDNGEASLAAGAPPPETLDAWELAVRKVYEQHVLRLQKQMLIADSKALEMGLNVQDFRDQIQRQEEEKQDLSDQVSSTKGELDSLREDQQQLGFKMKLAKDMEATRKNYDGQLGMLTEHICVGNLEKL
eukprot:s69_g9.t1